jgi:hypothetical protein
MAFRTEYFGSRRRARLNLYLYGFLALLGGAYAAQDMVRGENPPGTAGFMVVFGAGMFIRTFLRSRQPVVTLRDDLMEVRQRMRQEDVPFRSITTVEQPEASRLVVKYRQGGETRTLTLWLSLLDPRDGEMLTEFLRGRKWRR